MTLPQPASQMSGCPGAGLDDRSLALGTLVEANGQFSFCGAQFGQNAFEGLEFGNVDGCGQAWEECSFGLVANSVRKVVGQRANDAGAVRSREEHGAAAAPGHIGAVNEIAAIDRVNAARRKRTVPGVLDGNMGRADEMDGGLGQSQCSPRPRSGRSIRLRPGRLQGRWHLVPRPAAVRHGVPPRRRGAHATRIDAQRQSGLVRESHPA